MRVPKICQLAQPSFGGDLQTIDNRIPQSDQFFQNCVGLDIYMEMTSITDSGTKKYGTVIMEPKTMEVFYRLLDKLLTELGGTLMT